LTDLWGVGGGDAQGSRGLVRLTCRKEDDASSCFAVVNLLKEEEEEKKRKKEEKRTGMKTARRG
jgi:hypothetical protein